MSPAHRSLDRLPARPAFALLVVAAIVLLACGEGPPGLETTAAPAAQFAPAPAPQGAPAPAAPDGVAALPAGAGPQDAPRAISFDPPLGATGVDPARTTLAVTFDRSMDPEGWAWVTESAATTPQIARSSWDAAVRVNTAEVSLAPGTTYVVWINSPQYLYFKDPQGRALAPVRWSFTTASAPAAGAPVDAVASH